LDRAAFQGIIPHLALDSEVVELQAVPNPYLVLLVIAAAYSGHAFAVHAGYHTLEASGHHERRTDEQGP